MNPFLFWLMWWEAFLDPPKPQVIYVDFKAKKVKRHG